MVNAGPFRPAGTAQRNQQAAEPAARASTEGGDRSGDVRTQEQSGQPQGQPQEAREGFEHPEQERREGAGSGQDPGQ